ncbi:MAG: ATP-binding protein [Dongiaceae bacterium]
MTRPIIATLVASEQDVVTARQRARQVARLLGFDPQDQTRIATAVSEIARNAFVHGGRGRVEFALEDRAQPQHLLVTVSDRGRGMPAPGSETAAASGPEAGPGRGLGLRAAQRLMDQVDIDSRPGEGTRVRLGKALPRRAPAVTTAMLAAIADQLARERPPDPLSEMREQNRELVDGLEALRQRQDELTRVNRELNDTNRGVVALYGELEDRAEQLRRANELKLRFMSNMTHEFRTPLNAILALTRLLLDRSDGPLTAEQEKQVTFVRQSAAALSELVNDLLDIAKVDAGKATTSNAEFAVADLFGALRGMLRPLRVGAEVELVFEAPADLPPIRGDERKVSQILRNFVSNALKFTERGSVVVSAALDAGRRIIFAVRDTGIGIAPEHHETIFEEFAQVENPLQSRVKGTGLGLALSRRLAELMGGRIRLESAPGAGSTFYLELPLVPPGEDEAAPVRPRLLLVDDDPVFRYTLRRVLGDEVEIGEAEDGAAGLRQAREQHPDAIFLDLAMPGMDGFAVLSALQQDAATRAIPVFVVSSAVLAPRELERLGAAAAILPKDQLSRQAVGELLAGLLAGLHRPAAPLSGRSGGGPAGPGRH